MSPPTAFVDTNVFVFATHDSPTGERARRLLRGAVEDEWTALTSTAVLEELWHLELRGRPPGLVGATRRVYELMSPLLPVDDATVAAALDLEFPALGANDRIHVATCRLHALTTIVTADADFDVVDGLQRIDPQIEDALAPILSDSNDAG